MHDQKGSATSAHQRQRRAWLCMALMSVAGALARAADESMSARIDSIQRTKNGVHITFTVSGAPDFVDVEGSPTLTGIYREEQNVEIGPVSPGVMRAFVPISTDDRFFRIRLLSQGTNTLVLPIEAENAFGDDGLPGFDRSPYQLIYAATEFSDAPTDVIDITEMAWRLNEPAFFNLDTTVSRLTISFGVYRGAMSDLPGRGFIQTDFHVTVFDHPNVRLTAPAGSPSNVFDVRFQFDKPYRYDRNLGQLVMVIGDTLESDGRDFDGARVSSDRGWVYLDDTPNRPWGTSSMVVTKFSYIAIPKP